MKEYNLILLDREKDEPSFESDICKFWLIKADDRYPIFTTQNIKTDERDFVIIDIKKNEIIKDSRQLESIFAYYNLLKSGLINKDTPAEGGLKHR